MLFELEHCVQRGFGSSYEEPDKPSRFHGVVGSEQQAHRRKFVACKCKRDNEI